MIYKKPGSFGENLNISHFKTWIECYKQISISLKKDKKYRKKERGIVEMGK